MTSEDILTEEQKARALAATIATAILRAKPFGSVAEVGNIVYLAEWILTGPVYEEEDEEDEGEPEEEPVTFDFPEGGQTDDSSG